MTDFEKARRHPVHTQYAVTKDGRVYSFKSNKELKPFLYGSPNKTQYHAVSVDGKSKKLSVLVLETYMGARPKGYHAAHLDGDHKNDNLNNLKWVTPKENNRHKIAHGRQLYGEKNPATPLTKNDVLYIRRNYFAKNSRVSNAKELAERFGVSRITIVNIVKGKTWINL